MPHRRRTLLTTAAIVLGAVVVAGAYAMLRTPGWYAPPVVPADERQGVRNNLLAAEQAFTEGLRAGRDPFTYHVHQEDVNRWIAMRREIYPLIDELAPSQLVDPFVLFADDEITVAGRCALGGVDVVLSIDFEAGFRDGAIRLRATSVRCGSVRIPLSWASLGLDQPIDRRTGKVWPGSPPMKGSLINGLEVGADAWWKNGGVAYRVLDARVRPGRLDLTVQPLGLRSELADSTHRSSEPSD